MKYAMADVRKQLYSAVVADALDQLGFRHRIHCGGERFNAFWYLGRIANHCSP